MKINMDSKSVFTDYLKTNFTFNQDEMDLIFSYFKQESVKNEAPLVIAGKKYTKIVFVISGIFRVFVIDPKGDEVVKNFIEPHSFFADIASLENNQNSLLNISAVTDCSILTLSKTDAVQLIQQLPKWEYFMQVTAMKAMNEMIRKQEFLHIGDSSYQYSYFVKHFPLLVKYVPLKYIASYLRITQSSLSRIRKQIQ